MRSSSSGNGRFGGRFVAVGRRLCKHQLNNGFVDLLLQVFGDRRFELRHRVVKRRTAAISRSKPHEKVAVAPRLHLCAICVIEEWSVWIRP